MIFEKSCGAVVYTRAFGEARFLIETMKKGRVSLCKGHVEPEDNGELTPQEAEVGVPRAAARALGVA